MTKRIFHSILWVSAFVFLVGFGMMTWVLYEDFGEELMAELKKEAFYVSEAVQYEGIDYLETISDQSERVTLVDQNGQVLYDNKADVSTMENHGEREEILEALEKGEGDAVRTSNTLGQETLYFAMRMEDGKVLRVSTSQDTLWVLMLDLLPPLILIAAIMTVMSALVSDRVSRRIVAPLNQLDLEHPEQNETYEEVAPLLTKLAKQQKTIERQLQDAKRQQEEFSVITNNMKEGLLVMDARGEVLSCNGSALKLFHADNVQKKDSVLSLNRSSQFQEMTEQVLKGQHKDTTVELGGRSVRMIANPVRNGEAVEGAVLLLVDVTEKIQREELRREFTANVSHELKTPLTSISGFAELLQAGLVKEEDMQKFAGRIFEEAQRLITLVNDIMEISQLDEDILPYDQEQIDLYAFGREILDRLEPEARKRSISLVIEGEPVQLLTVRKVLDEVVYNLCDNAIKYNRDGGKVLMTVGAENGRKFLSVKDTGIGIPEEHQRRIFERFYRVDKSHSRSMGGTGLGLSIVKHGAVCLGAEISLSSKEGFGAEFVLSWKEET